MAGTDKSYRRKTTPQPPIVRTAINSFGQPETYLDRHDIYEEVHHPNQYVMDSDGICQSNPGMSSGYYQPSQYREQNPDGTYKHYVEKTAINSFGQPETYNEFTQSTAGRQGIFHGGSGDPKIKPREHIFQVASQDFTGTCKIVLVDNITSDLRDMQIVTSVPWSPYTGDGIVGAWVMVGDKLVYVSEATDVYTGLTVRDMINAPVYLKDETSDTITKSVPPKPLYIENIDASPEWVLLTSFTTTNVFSTPEYYT